MSAVVEVREDPAGGARPFLIVSTLRGVETVQERHATRAEADAALPEIRKALRRGFCL